MVLRLGVKVSYSFIFCVVVDQGFFELGGISFFSPQSGFVCDNVVNYEVGHTYPYGYTILSLCFALNLNHHS